MAAIASSDVTYSITDKAQKLDSGNLQRIVSISFGNGTLTYPAGGIPLLKASMGLPNNILSVDIVDAANANGFIYKYDKANNKLRIYQGDNTNVAAAPAVELGGAAAPAAATLILSAIGY